MIIKVTDIDDRRKVYTDGKSLIVAVLKNPGCCDEGDLRDPTESEEGEILKYFFQERRNKSGR
jgi:hypothetical protein